MLYVIISKYSTEEKYSWWRNNLKFSPNLTSKILDFVKVNHIVNFQTSFATNLSAHLFILLIICNIYINIYLNWIMKIKKQSQKVERSPWDEEDNTYRDEHTVCLPSSCNHSFSSLAWNMLILPTFQRIGYSEIPSILSFSSKWILLEIDKSHTDGWPKILDKEAARGVENTFLVRWPILDAS